MRVVHVLDPLRVGPDVVRLCAHAMTAPDIEHHAWLLGSTRDREYADALGVSTPTVLTETGPIPSPSLAAMKRTLVTHLRRWQRDGRSTVVCAYSLASLERVVSALPARRDEQPAVCALLDDAAHTTPRVAWRAVARPSAMQGREVCVPTRDQSRRLGAGGGRVSVLGSIPSLQAFQPREPGVLRLGLLPARGVDADARWFVFLCGLLAKAGEDVEGWLPASAGATRRCARFWRAHHRQWPMRIIAGDVPTSEWIGACDLAIQAPGAADSLATATALAAGVVVVGPHGQMLGHAERGEAPRAYARAVLTRDQWLGDDEFALHAPAPDTAAFVREMRALWARATGDRAKPGAGVTTPQGATAHA